MAVARNVIEFILSADASGLIGPLQKARDKFTDLEKEADKSGKSVGTGLDGLAQRMSSLGTKMLGVGAAMTAATLPLTIALKSGVSALMDAEKRAAQTNAVLQSTGQVAGVSAEHVGELAGQLRDMSGVSGGVIREGENMLLTFTNIRNAAGKGGDVFDRTTKAALDMSVAMGTDMKTASTTLGKALNDPINGLTRLQRIGVQFTDGQKQQIQNFVRMGDVASAQGVILDEVSKKFGGSAQAFGETTAGQMAKAEAAFAQVKMSLASGLAPALGTIATVLQKVAGGFNELDSGTKSVIGGVALFTVALGPLTTLAGGVLKGVSAITAGLDTMRGKFASLRESGGILNALKNNVGGIAIGLGGLAAAIGTDLLISKLHQIRDAAGEAEDATIKGLSGQIHGYGDLEKALDSVGRRLDDLHRQQENIAGKEGLPKGPAPDIANVKGDIELDEQIKRNEKAFTEYAQRIDYTNSVLGTLQHETGMSREELVGLANTLGQDLSTQDSATKFQQMAEAINDIGNKSGLSRDQVVQLAQTFGVDLTGNTTAAAEQLQKLAQGVGSLESTTGYTTEQIDSLAKKLGIDLEQGGDAASATVQKFAKWAHQAGYDSQIAAGQVTQLGNAINATISPWLSSEQTLLQYQQALQGIPEQVKQIAESHGTQAEKATEAQLAMNQLTQQSVAAYLAGVQQGLGQEQLNGLLGQAGGALDALAKSNYPGAKEAAQKYKEQLEAVKQLGVISNTIVIHGLADAVAGLGNILTLMRRIKAPEGVQNVVGGIYGAFSAVSTLTGGGYRGGSIVGDTAYLARGGVANSPTVVYGEGNPAYPEYFIATNPAYADRNRKLLGAASTHFMAEGGVVGASSTAVGGDGAAAGGDAVPVLVQIRDLLAQALASGAVAPPPTPVADVLAPPTASAAPSSGPAAAAPPAPGGGSEATSALAAATTAYGAAAATTAVQAQAFDAQVTQSATATLPAATAATQLSDTSIQALTNTVAADLPLQGAWQGALAGSQVQLGLTTAAVQALTAAMNVLNATQVQLHVEHGQVEEAGQSIAGLASAVTGALGKLGLDNNALGQWLGVVLALPQGTLAGALETGGVVGNVGAGMKGHSPTLVMEGSRSYDEYVIPTDPKHRSNALNLLGGLHQDLGVAAMASGGVIGKTPWSGTAATAPGTLGAVDAGSMIAAAAFNVGGGGSQRFVDYAMAQSGDRYVWGAEGPDAWDCSGLVLGAAAAAGLPGLPHYSGSQIDMASKIPVGQAIATPGAILWHPGHIAISRGNGQTIEARGVAYGVGSWGAEGRFTQGGLLPFPGASGSVADALPSKWATVGRYISDRFRESGIGVGPSVGGESGEAGGGGPWTGRISNFGGPGDYQPTKYGPNTQTMYNQGFPYAAMRLTEGSYGGQQGEIPLPPRSWVAIAHGGAATKAQILDWGPRGDLNRLIDVAPYVESAIGAVTNDTVTVAALAAGGKVGTYDSGGFLPEGLSLAYNGTGSPEPVIPASKIRGGDGATQVTVNVTVHGSVSTEEDLVDAIARGLQSRSRRGYTDLALGGAGTI